MVFRKFFWEKVFFGIQFGRFRTPKVSKSVQCTHYTVNEIYLRDISQLHDFQSSCGDIWGSMREIETIRLRAPKSIDNLALSYDMFQKSPKNLRKCRNFVWEVPHKSLIMHFYVHILKFQAKIIVVTEHSNSFLMGLVPIKSPET